MPDDEVFNIDQLDEFLPIAGADSILADEKQKPTVFSAHEKVEDDFLDLENKPLVDTTAAILKELDADFIPVVDEPEKEVKIRKNAKNPEFGAAIQHLFDNKVIVPFDDDKTIDEYSAKDLQELLEANFADRDSTTEKKVKTDLYESLPAQVKTVLNYIEQGGTDISGIMSAVLRGEQIQQMDVNADSHELVRQYLKLENKKWDDAKIETVIQSYEDIGKLEMWGEIAKEKLQEITDKDVADALQSQTERKDEALKIRKQFTENVYQALEKGELNGIKIDKTLQGFLYKELTNSNYTSYTGRPTNLLGHLLEQHQFSKEPRYDLIAEATWLLSKPEEYRESVRKQIVTENTKDVVRKLKTEESRTLSSTVVPESKDEPARKLVKPRNIFAR
jgi:hypothetical protein